MYIYIYCLLLIYRCEHIYRNNLINPYNLYILTSIKIDQNQQIAHVYLNTNLQTSNQIYIQHIIMSIHIEITIII
jgi:hypothetical protein